MGPVGRGPSEHHWIAFIHELHNASGLRLTSPIRTLKCRGAGSEVENIVEPFRLVATLFRLVVTLFRLVATPFKLVVTPFKLVATLFRLVARAQ